MTYEELRTVIAEIEGIMNSRPLCYLYSDDTEEVITPSHLMLGRRLMSIQNTNKALDENETQVTLSKKMKYIKFLVDHYWQRWRTEYVTQLREYQKVGKTSKLIKEGDIVVIFNHEKKRNRWKLGKVVKLICGADNIPRAAMLRICSDDKAVYIKRPITKLYPLEVNAKVDVSDSEKAVIPDIISDDETDDDDVTYERPSRAAAEAGILKRRLANQS